MPMKKYRSIWQINLIFLLVLVSGYFCARSEFSKPDGRSRHAPLLQDLVKKFGFKLEIHEVRTEDNYILTVFRVPKPNSGYSPVFLQHGIHASGAHFLANQRAMAYYLLNQGYDVWIGNARGTKFSLDHVTLSSLDDQFWKFSFHEMGVFDIPAVLNHILEVTDKRKVHYVGHSMGATMFLVMASVRPDTLNVVQSVIFLAPVARPKHMGLIEKPFKRKVINSAMTILSIFGIKTVKVPKWLGQKVRNMCMGDGRMARWCRKKLGGNNEANFDLENTLLKCWWLLDDTPLKNHAHFLQIAKAGRFQEFDYGKNKNERKYGQPTPPEYNIGGIKKRIFLISGGADKIAQEKDIGWLHNRLQQPWLITSEFEEFSHTNFNYGNQIERLHQTVGKLVEVSELNKNPQDEFSRQFPIIPPGSAEEDESLKGEDIGGASDWYDTGESKIKPLKKFSAKSFRTYDGQTFKLHENGRPIQKSKTAGRRQDSEKTLGRRQDSEKELVA